jgi:hypothetical protein
MIREEGFYDAEGPMQPKSSLAPPSFSCPMTISVGCMPRVHPQEASLWPLESNKNDLRAGTICDRPPGILTWRKCGRVRTVYSSLPVHAFSRAELSMSELENLNSIVTR